MHMLSFRFPQLFLLLTHCSFPLIILLIISHDIAGNISVAVLHEWLQDIVAEVPPYLEEGADRMRLLFRNSYTGAIATVQLAKDEIAFESQSASTVAIFKEGLTALANARRVQVQEKLDVNDASMYDFLQLLRPHVEHLLRLTKKVEVIDAVAEIVHAETGSAGSSSSDLPPWLTAEYANLYRDSAQIRAEVKSRHKRLEYISGIITDLHVDWHRLRGVDARGRLPEVAAALKSGQWERVVETIMGPKRGNGERSQAQPKYAQTQAQQPQQSQQKEYGYGDGNEDGGLSVEDY